MKNYTNIIIVFLLTFGVISCDDKNELDPIEEVTTPKVALTAGSADFSNYVAIGTSFTAGFTDGALFKAGQTNSFPNILANKFAKAGGGTFNQPLMKDNIGGLLLLGNKIQEPRLYFNGTAPTSLSETPTTEANDILKGSFNNLGIPGAKSFHLVAEGYGNVANLSKNLANPYFVRMASKPNATVLEDAVAQKPTFFTLSEIGGNDVLSYATSGGDGTESITPKTTFDASFKAIVNALTANGAKGVLANIPYITSLAHFTTVPYNALDPSSKDLASQIPTLNLLYGTLNQIFTKLGETNRIVKFSTTEANPIVIKDEKLTNLSTQITAGLNANAAFSNFLQQQFNLPASTAPLVANLLGSTYGQSRPATKDDLFVLPSSIIIGKPNTNSVASLEKKQFPKELATQFSVEGVTLPLEDKWVLTPEEQKEIKDATDGYNATIKSVAEAKGLALVDLKTILSNIVANGYVFDEYTMTTKLVTGGLISLDGIHLTARGYAMMANEILLAIDKTYGSNFGKATNGLAKAKDYPTTYSRSLK